MKRSFVLALFLCFAFLLFSDYSYSVMSDPVDYGTCGSNLTWALYDNGTLKISGTGEMEDYELEDQEYPWHDYYDTVEVVVIEEGVTSVASGAFENFIQLEEVSFPLSLTDIGAFSFSGCVSLSVVSIPNNVTIIRITAFENCISLQKVDIPKSVRTIGIQSFYGCSNLQSISFYGSTTIINTTIKNEAFSGCSRLEKVFYSGNAIQWAAISIEGQNAELISAQIIYAQHFGVCGDNVFWALYDDMLLISGCGATYDYGDPSWGTEIPLSPWFDYKDDIKKVSINLGITEIGSFSFVAHDNLKEIIIADTVQNIEDCAFKDCSGLQSIVVPDSVERIDGVFLGCTQLDDITLSSNLVYIGPESFKDCISLQQIVIPDSVVAIDLNAFKNCISLKSISISKYVTRIGTGAFACCEKLTGIHVDIDNPVYCDIKGCLYSKDLSQLICCPGTYSGICWICDGVTTIAPNAFDSCRFIETIMIPSSVQSIEHMAFYNCDNLSDVYYNGSSAAWNSISISSDNTSLSDASKHFVQRQGQCGADAYWTLYNDGLLIVNGSGLISDNTGISSNEQIRKVIISEGITSIGDWAFSSNWNLSEVVISSGVLSIGDWAFNSCPLRTVFLPDSVVSIGDNPWFNCIYLESITVDVNNTEYCDLSGVLFKKDHTELIALPAAYTGSYTVPNGVISINDYACTCYSLTEVILPDTLSSIGEGAFNNCLNLSSIVLPSQFKRIGKEAFSGCNNLLTITVPRSITTIEENAFYGCGLTTVFYGGSQREWNSLILSIDSGNDPLLNATIFYETIVAQSGICGNDVRWDLYTDGTLIISGNGDMYDYTFSNRAPWNEYNDQITSIVVESDITRIGNYSFYAAHAKTLTIEDASLAIGEYACAYNINLTEIDFGKGTVLAGYRAFMYCDTLRSVHLPANVVMKNVSTSTNGCGTEMFSNCSSLKTAVVDCSYIAPYLFAYDNVLESVTITDSDVRFYYLEDDSRSGNPFYSQDDSMNLTVIGPSCSSIPIFVDTINAEDNPKCILSFELIQNDPGHRRIVEDLAKEPTCEGNGLTEGSHCNACGQVLIKQNVLPAHGHNYGNITYEWMDNNNLVKSTAFCTYDNNHVCTEIVTTIAEVTKEATETEYGETTYTAIFTNEIFETQIKVVADIEPLPAVCSIGDADGDGKVGMRDRVLLSRYLAGWAGAAEAIPDLSALDINGDGKVNAKDRVILSRYLANWGAEYDQYFDRPSLSGNYGILLKTGADSGANSSVGYAQLFLADGTEKEFEVSSTVSGVITGITWENSYAQGALVYYVSDVSDVIVEMTVADITGAGTGQFDVNGMFNGYALDNSTVVFTYDGKDADKASSYCVVSASDLYEKDFTDVDYIVSSGLYKAVKVSGLPVKPSYAAFVSYDALTANGKIWTGLFEGKVQDFTLQAGLNPVVSTPTDITLYTLTFVNEIVTGVTVENYSIVFADVTANSSVSGGYLKVGNINYSLDDINVYVYDESDDEWTAKTANALTGRPNTFSSIALIDVDSDDCYDIAFVGKP